MKKVRNTAGAALFTFIDADRLVWHQKENGLETVLERLDG